MTWGNVAEPGGVGNGPSHVHWLKIADPDTSTWAVPSPGSDFRVLLPAEPHFDDVAQKLGIEGAQVRRVQYLLEQESISTLARPDGALAADVTECWLARPVPKRYPAVIGRVATAAFDAFDLMWQTHAPVADGRTEPIPAIKLVPPGWLRYLPYPVLNPAQAEAVPHIVRTDEPLLVVAPTGAGKTVIGMTAVLRTVLEQRRKAAWLVPQRSLTDELNRELDGWRDRGLRVERLSGEYRVDVDRVRNADLWVATTEKFEAICRATSLREALAEVGCLVVDEIHLLGDPARGPVLEALLARVRGGEMPMRIVGLSATIANDDQIAQWLGARLLRIAWRPSRLTWQLPVIASHPDWGLVDAARTRLTSAITIRVTAEGGSVLVFCGSKRIVRRTALNIAASRGANVNGVHPDDIDRLHEVCTRMRIGLHYKGWEHKREAEKAFRARELDVLVATSTLAAGVNMPARAVVIRDTEVGMKDIDVATVQQMFGRAGRTGQGEREGWAFLVVDESERARWQARLVDGHRVEARIRSTLADHLLAEAVQRRVGSRTQAENWWRQTLASHQGHHDRAALHAALDFLIESGYLVARASDTGGPGLAPTDLGTMTSRMMVSATVGDALRRSLATARPTGPEEAEEALIAALSASVPGLTQAPISEALKPVVSRLLATRGHLGRLSTDTSGLVPVPYQPGDLARATLLLAARTPDAFHAGARNIAGVPYASMYPVLEEAPRYLQWFASQGFLGSVHPWWAIVAADLGRRIKWRRCQPVRGAGRLLWMCEQMATSIHAEDDVPTLYAAAVGNGVGDPDWNSTGLPTGCRLDVGEYAALLDDRATRHVLELQEDKVTLVGSTPAVLNVWTGDRWTAAAAQRGRAVLAYPGGDGPHGAAVFTWRGDYLGTGWLSAYRSLTVPVSDPTARRGSR